MQSIKHIAILLPDTLQCLGLQSLLVNYFPPVEISYFYTFEALVNSHCDIFDYFFTNATLFVLNVDFFLPRRSKTIVLTADSIEVRKNTSINYVYVQASQEVIIEQLKQYFSGDNTILFNDSNKELSVREVEVLQIIVKGGTNKEIADKLCISLNTVLTHRKNITAKLGIKTVSGLTFYAIMNGLVSGEDIEL